MNNRLTRTVALLAVGSLVAVSCGGDDDDTEPPADEAVGPGCEEVDLSSPPEEPVEIRMGHGQATEDPVWLQYVDPELAGAQYNGSFYTIDATAYEPVDRLEAYQRGELDAGTISAPQLFMAADQGLPLVAVANIALVTEDGFRFPYMALEDSGIEGTEDLEGRTIGIIGPTTSTEYWVFSAAADAGLDPSRDLETVTVPPPAADQALRSGEVDVAMYTDSFFAQSEEGGVVEVFDAMTGPGFEQELLDVFFDRIFIEEHPEAYCAWRADYQASMTAFLDNRAAVGEALIEGGVLPEGLTVEIYENLPLVGTEPEGRINLENVDRLIEDMNESGFLDDVDVTAEELVIDGYSLTS